MSWIDVAIPGIIGLVVLLRPKVMFVGSRATATEKKIRVLRYVGGFLLLVALFNVVAKFVHR